MSDYPAACGLPRVVARRGASNCSAMTDAAGSCRSDSTPLGRARRGDRGWDINPSWLPFLGQGEKISCRRPGLVEILAASAVNAASDGEVKQLDPKRAHLRPPGPRQLYKADLPNSRSL